MSGLNSDVHGKAIRETVTLRAGTNPDADAIAQSTLSTWQQIAAQLEPVIGARGVDALFGRSLHLVGKTYRWLGGSGARGSGADALASIQASFKGQETSVATDAACALLATFTGLPANLIGESLTMRLLDVVWLLPSSQTQKEQPTCPTK
jgi:hypothetical protein